MEAQGKRGGREPMSPLSMLIKPVSSDCNIACRYCFYQNLSKSRKTASFGHMTDQVLETLVQKALACSEKSCAFLFQGGEPMLAGLAYYKKLLALENRYNTHKVSITHAIQTNGLLLNDDWARFLGSHHFLVGLSLDGPKDIHDFNRQDTSGRGTFAKVIRAARLLEKYGVAYNVLAVVTALSARHTARIYDFFKKNHFLYLQFIPCLDPLGEAPESEPYSLRPMRYADFLKKLFDLWYADVCLGVAPSIRMFDNFIMCAAGGQPEACGMTGSCACQHVVEADGSVYPCDFYATDDWRLGTILESPLNVLDNTPKAKKFVEDSHFTAPPCHNCKWFYLCRGGCRRNREPFQDGHLWLNHYCAAYKRFFDYAGSRILSLAKRLPCAPPHGTRGSL